MDAPFYKPPKEISNSDTPSLIEQKKKNYNEYSKQELIEEIKQLKKRKKYGLVWEDKKEEVVEMCKKKLPIFKEVKNKEIITDKNKQVNLLIEGDNYHALSVLNYTHAKKVDVIYIDPPYNTGNKDFIFNDHYVDREDAYKHSKWLSFMEKRLKLAKNLLKDTGVIFISIDDNEVAQLKLLMNNPDLFGENNFLAIQIWRGMHTVRNSSKEFNHNTEYILTYCKNINRLIDPGDRDTYLRIPKDKSESYPHNDNDGKGPYKLDPIYSRNYYSPYEIEFPNGVRWSAPRGNYPRYSKKKLLHMYQSGELVFSGKEPKAKRHLKNVQEGVPPNTLIPTEEVGFNKDGTSLLFELFGKKVFDQPKPVRLIKYLLKIYSKKLNSKEAVILDFMAGTGTTGQAVLELNKEDGGNRRFILCTNNEDNNGNGYKIAEDVCYSRIKKVIEGYKNLKGKKIEGFGGNLKYFKTDFVNYDEPTDRNKIKLTEQATEMLCVKEGTFELVLDGKDFKIFKNTNHYTGVILDQTAIPSFKKAIKDIKGKFSVYVFSLGDETFDEEFKDVKQKVKLSPIPEAILRVYRRIFK